jgi:hypothetical protein
VLEILPGGFPVQRGEGGDVVNRPGGKLRQDVVEVFAQVDLEAFTGLHDREDGRNFRTGFWASDMQPVLATNCQAAHGILAEVLIDLDAAVFKIKLQPWPLVEGVLAGFSEFAQWQSMRSDLGDLRLEFLKEGNASLPAQRQTLLLGGSSLASFLFYRIELAHEQDRSGLAVPGDRA